MEFEGEARPDPERVDVFAVPLTGQIIKVAVALACRRMISESGDSARLLARMRDAVVLGKDLGHDATKLNEASKQALDLIGAIQDSILMSEEEAGSLEAQMAFAASKNGLAEIRRELHVDDFDPEKIKEQQ